MIESTVLHYIKTKMNIDTYLVAPADKPSKYILLRKSASEGDKFIEDASFIIDCVSQNSLLEAAQMNDILKDYLYNMPYEVKGISHTELNSDGNWTDTTTKEFRYESIWIVTYHR